MAVLVSCAGIEKRYADAQDRDREQFLRYAGPPVESFRYLGFYKAWQLLGNGQFAMWTDVNDVHLLTVQQPCPALEFAEGLKLTSYNRLVTRGIDYVQVRDQQCHITEIRPVDYLRMKQELRRPS